MPTRCFLLSPTAVFKARVNQNIFLYPVSEVKFDTVTVGAYTDVKPGMTVMFGTSDGSGNEGRQRIRKAATSDTLYIGRSSVGNRDGEVYTQVDSYITVYDDYRLWAKIPYILPDGTIYKDDDVTVGTKTDDIPPKANIEPPHAAGDISSGGSVLTVSFSGTGSYALSGTISSYLWDVDDGTITVGTAASSAITATFPAGFRWVSLTVTDSNANTHTMRIPVYARNPASDTTIKSFQIERQRITPQGQEISLRILESIPEITYPDGTLVMIWDEDLDTITTADHMQFVGWHQNDPAEISAERTALLSEVSLECLDVAGKLRTLPGFPISVEGNDSPSTWLEMSSPNMDKYIDYIFRWHSTAFELASVTLSGTGSTYPFVILSSDAQSLWEQAARRAQSLVPDYVLTCDRKGRIAMKPDPMIVKTTDRTSTVQTTIDESEWSNITYTHQRAPRVYWLRSEAVLASADSIGAFFCVAPDDTPGQGVSSRTQGEQLATNQAELNIAEGNRYARLNAFESPFSIQLASGNDYDMEPANMTWVRLTMGANYAAQRGLNFTDERGLIQEINITRRYGRTGEIKDISLTWERETSGQPASTYIPPTTGIDDDIPYEPIPDPGFNPDPAPTVGTGFGTVFVATGDTLAKTGNFGASSPSWTDVTPSSVTTVYDFILDPWNPATTGYVTTDLGVHKSTNLNGSPTWTLVLSAATAVAAVGASTWSGPYKILGSINLEDYVAVLFLADTNECYCAYSTNGGTSWSYSSIIGGITVRGWLGAADIVPHVIGGDLRLFMAAQFTGGNLGLFQSDNKGATWSLTIGSPPLPDPDFKTPHGLCVHCPYDNNASGNIVYMSFNNSLYGYYTTDLSTINLLDGDTGTSAKRGGVETYTLDRNRVIHWRPDGTLRASVDGGATFSQQSASNLTGTVRASGGFPFNASLYYALTTDGVFVSIDGGQTFIDKTGDWSFGFTIAAGQGVIVPVWTE